MKKNNLIVIITILFIFLGCSGKVKTELITLPNGKQVELQHIKPWVVGDGSKILILTYITEIPIDDIDSVQRDVDEIWPWYQKIVDENGFILAGIRASNIVNEGLFRWETRNYTFGYEKKDGIWIQLKS